MVDADTGAFLGQQAPVFEAGERPAHRPPKLPASPGVDETPRAVAQRARWSSEGTEVRAWWPTTSGHAQVVEPFQCHRPQRGHVLTRGHAERVELVRMESSYPPEAFHVATAAMQSDGGQHLLPRHLVAVGVGAQPRGEALPRDRWHAHRQSSRHLIRARSLPDRSAAAFSGRVSSAAASSGMVSSNT